MGEGNVMFRKGNAVMPVAFPDLCRGQGRRAAGPARIGHA